MLLFIQVHMYCKSYTMRNLIASWKSVLYMLAMQEHVRALNYLIHPMSIVKGLKHCQRFVALVGQRLLHLLFTVPSSEVSDSDNNVRSETIIYCIKETRTHRFVFLMLFKICQHFETEKKIKNKSSCN